MDKLYWQDRTSDSLASLQQVLEFCACFPSTTIRHDLVFRPVKGWSVARPLVDAAEHCGLELIAVEFGAEGDGHLHIALRGRSASAVVKLWQGIGTASGAPPSEWQSRAQFAPNGKESEDVA